MPYGTPVNRAWFTREVYGYDAMNRLTLITRDEEPTLSDQFGYYLDGELKWAKYGVNGQQVPTRWVDYDLDKAGNRTGAAGVTANGDQFNYVPNALNQYTTAHGGSVSNGVNHEIISYDGKNYAYLNDTHLAQATYTDGSGPHPYKLGYDPLGRCVKRTTGTSAVTYYIYDGERSIYEFEPSGGTPSINVYGRGIDELVYRSNHGSGQYPMQDHEGSVIVVTGGDGSVLEWYRYDAFGAPTMYKPDGSVIQNGASMINNRFLFTGREYAPQYGFYEYRARAYHPGIGRFMSEDPMLFVHNMGLAKAPDDWTFEKHPDEAELSLFRYCLNDPLDHFDPNGESPVLVGILVAGLILGNVDIANAPQPGDPTPGSHGMVGMFVDAAAFAGGTALGKSASVLFRAAAARFVAGKVAQNMRNVLAPGGKLIGEAGSQASIRNIQAGLKEAQSTFKQLSQGGRIVKDSGYPGTLVEMADGGRVGLRTVATKSPGTVATIDVNTQQFQLKLKFTPPQAEPQ